MRSARGARSLPLIIPCSVEERRLPSALRAAVPVAASRFIVPVLPAAAPVPVVAASRFIVGLAGEVGVPDAPVVPVLPVAGIVLGVVADGVVAGVVPGVVLCANAKPAAAVATAQINSLGEFMQVSLKVDRNKSAGPGKHHPRFDPRQVR